MSDIGLCKYKDALGKPREGFRKYRVFDVAVSDCFFTIIGALMFSKISGISPGISIVGFFAFGIIMHRLFCVNTTFNKAIFGEI